MSNTKRPSTARKVTPRSEKTRKDALDQGLRITMDGQSFDVRLGDVTPAMARELRNNTGMGPLQLINATSISPDVDLLSAFVWLARRQRGEFVSFDAVEVSYKQMLSDGFDVSLPEAEDAESGPEA